jgi:hypothetical protein
MWTRASPVSFGLQNSFLFAFSSHQTSALIWRADLPSFYITKLDFSCLLVSSVFDKSLGWKKNNTLIIFN